MSYPANANDSATMGLFTMQSHIAKRNEDVIEKRALDTIVNNTEQSEDDASDSGETMETDIIRVSDIEVSGFKDTIKVDETIDLTAVVLPQNATEQTLFYYSVDNAVATVSSSGKITGRAAGETDIVVEADGIKKVMRLCVKTPTDKLVMNRDYIVMKIGDSVRLEISILPASADQTIELKSSDTEVATVTGDGMVTANGLGSASIIVKTWDTSRVVNVIVNSGDLMNADVSLVEGDPIEANSATGSDFSLKSTKAVSLLQDIVNSSDDAKFIVSGADMRIVTSDILKVLYGTRKELTVVHDSYTVNLLGADILNINNELDTVLELTFIDGNLQIITNGENSLPGKIDIKIMSESDYEFLYIYNNTTNAYEKLNAVYDKNSFYVNFSGKYLFCENELISEWLSWGFIAVLFVILVGASVIFVAIRKRHWFW
jgi:hypothetical protein